MLRRLLWAMDARLCGRVMILTQDIIFDYIRTGKKNPVLKLNY
jgi:hypothetical protein